jgi:sec-independent protein translocase protein TatA
MELGAGELIIIMVIVLLLFGPSKLPKLGEGLGTALANFRKAVRGEEPKQKPAEPPPPAALPEAQKPAAQPEASREGAARSGGA